jgi:hypothetical protein
MWREWSDRETACKTARAVTRIYAFPNGLGWTPDAHFVCREAFHTEVRTLMLSLLRLKPVLPKEVVYIIIRFLSAMHHPFLPPLLED